MLNKTFFITGTDTEIGKTTATSALLRAASHVGMRTAALKPIAAGCEYDAAQGWQNEDALTLQAATNSQQTYQEINPFALPEACSPHIAARAADVSLTVKEVYAVCVKSLQKHYDLLCIEGAGGWYAPLNDKETFADLAVKFNQPVILVVGMKLGCLNHALLTAKAITDSGLPLYGWIADNLSADMPWYQDNLAWLEKTLAAPLLAQIPHLGREYTQWQDFPLQNMELV